MEVEQLYQPNGETSVDLSNNTDISQLCRICGNASEYLIPIFEGEGLENELEMKIKKHLPIQVSREDEMPINLCYQCASTLIAWHDLTLGCIQADKKLQHLVRSCFKEESSAQDKIEEGDGVDSIEEMSDIEIEFEEEEEVTTNPSTSSQVNFLSSTSNTNEVPVVLQVAEEKNQAKEVERNKNSAVETTSSERSPFTNILFHKAKIVRGKYLLVPLKGITIRKKMPAQYNCRYCKEVFLDISKFNEHKSSHKMSKTSSKLKPINKIGDNSNKQLSVEDTVVYKCDECGKRYRYRESYIAHKMTHTGERPFVCHICGVRFVRYKGLDSHIKCVHLKVKDHICEYCGRCFTLKASFEEHQRIHTGERPYVCDACGKTFKAKSSLNIHSKCHKNLMPYVCPHCQRGFNRNHHLVNHLITHTKERNFVCEICDKKFHIKYDMERHKKLHSGLRPFKCSLCKSDFADKRYLTKHLRTHQKE